MKASSAQYWLLVAVCIPLSSYVDQCQAIFPPRKPPIQASIWRSTSLPRGGDEAEADDAEEASNQDDERYSRQLYTLGARAQKLVRSSTVFIDGPPTSGLVYECAKNLALSGVGSIQIWKPDDERKDQDYHDKNLDDLGRAYCRAAAQELNIGGQGTSNETDESILGRYIRCLNPTVAVSHSPRPKDSDADGTDNDAAGGPGVLLCIDRPYDTQVRLNQMARQRNIAFVAVETAGVYGRLFCDFGSHFEVHDSDGETPLVTPLDTVKVHGEELLVRAMETERHDVSSGDILQFQMSDGSIMPQQFAVVKVLSPQQIIIKLHNDLDEPKAQDLESVQGVLNEKAASFSRLKIPVKMSFSPLEEVFATAKEIVEVQESMARAKTKHSMEHNLGNLCTPCDFDKSFDEARLRSVLSCFQALSSFAGSHKSLPTLTDVLEFQKLAKESLGAQTLEAKHVQNFLSCCAGKLGPFQAMFGALGAQEAMKAVTGLYNPVKQVLLYDCDELLSENNVASDDVSLQSGLAYILGRAMEEKVKATRLFVVGAGAIGCELMKNLAALGLGTGRDGCVSLTDNDTIEKSNLSRQLLFRESDIGDFKSVAAKAAILRFNPATNVNAHTSKVGEENGSPFGENFWASNADIVLNALDNMEARLFMDQQCVAYQKALVDAGTLGPKGNVQVVVPHQSESYGSSVDPPESEIPVCTLKNFPYAIAHTIQWGRDLFDGLYNRRPKQTNDFAYKAQKDNLHNLAETLISELGDEGAIETATELEEDLFFASEPLQSRSDVRRCAIVWAVRLATRLFYDAIEDLLREHPVDSLDDDGERFWGGTRKVPTAIRFYPSTEDTSQLAANDNLMSFVKSAARLRLEAIHSRSDGDDNHFTDEEARAALVGAFHDEEGTCDGHDTTEGTIVRKLQQVASGEKITLSSVDFEKDDNDNGHVEFVTAASNLRAICYGIPPVDAMETRRVAGRIIPAMVTTTAVVSALSCVELLKLLQGAPLVRYRNAFINLAIPLLAFTVPLPAEEVSGPGGMKFTVWDSIVIKDKQQSTKKDGVTLKRFIRQLEKSIGARRNNELEVSSVTMGELLIYANFLHAEDETLLRRSLWDLASAAASEEGTSTGNREYTRLDLRVTVEDTANGEDYELPAVRVTRGGREVNGGDNRSS